MMLSRGDSDPNLAADDCLAKLLHMRFLQPLFIGSHSLQLAMSGNNSPPATKIEDK